VARGKVRDERIEQARVDLCEKWCRTVVVVQRVLEVVESER
jgi:hypothetical protein